MPRRVRLIVSNKDFEYVERPEDIWPALERTAAAVVDGRARLVNVVTAWRARAQTLRFSQTTT